MCFPGLGDSERCAFLVGEAFSRVGEGDAEKVVLFAVGWDARLDGGDAEDARLDGGDAELEERDAARSLLLALPLAAGDAAVRNCVADAGAKVEEGDAARSFVVGDAASSSDM